MRSILLILCISLSGFFFGKAINKIGTVINRENILVDIESVSNDSIPTKDYLEIFHPSVRPDKQAEGFCKFSRYDNCDKIKVDSITLSDYDNDNLFVVTENGEVYYNDSLIYKDKEFAKFYFNQIEKVIYK